MNIFNKNLDLFIHNAKNLYKLYIISSVVKKKTGFHKL